VLCLANVHWWHRGCRRKTVKMQGLLEKRSAWLQKWSIRFFRLHGRTLCYYNSPSDQYSRGTIPLIGAHVELLTRGDSRFQNITNPKRTIYQWPFLIVAKDGSKYFLSAESEDQRAIWFDSVSRAISGNRKSLPPVAALVNLDDDISSSQEDNAKACCDEKPNVKKYYPSSKLRMTSGHVDSTLVSGGASDPLSHLLQQTDVGDSDSSAHNRKHSGNKDEVLRSRSNSNMSSS